MLASISVIMSGGAIQMMTTLLTSFTLSSLRTDLAGLSILHTAEDSTPLYGPHGICEHIFKLGQSTGHAWTRKRNASSNGPSISRVWLQNSARILYAIRRLYIA